MATSYPLPLLNKLLSLLPLPRSSSSTSLTLDLLLDPSRSAVARDPLEILPRSLDAFDSRPLDALSLESLVGE